MQEERTVADDNERTVAHEGWFRRHRLKVVASLFVAAGFGWLLHAGALPLIPPERAWQSVKWWTFPAYIAMWSAVHFIRAARWAWLLEPLHPTSVRRVTAVAFVGFAALVVLPLRAGEAVRPFLIRKKGHLSGWAATGTVGAERVIDGLIMSLFLLTALQMATPLSPLPDHIGDLPISASLVPRAAYAALFVFAVAFALMGVFYWRRDFARRVTHRLVGLVSHRLAEWLSERVERVADGLRFLPEARYTLPFTLATVSYWAINAAGTWLLAWGCGLTDYSFWHATVTTGVLALGVLVPNAPGYFGAYQISVYASFAMYYPSETVASAGAAYVFLAYAAQLLITLAGGAWGLWSERTPLSVALDTD